MGRKLDGSFGYAKYIAHKNKVAAFMECRGSLDDLGRVEVLVLVWWHGGVQICYKSRDREII